MLLDLDPLEQFVRTQLERYLQVLVILFQQMNLLLFPISCLPAYGEFSYVYDGDRLSYHSLLGFQFHLAFQNDESSWEHLYQVLH
jgi:hypothetical protein